MKLRPYLNWLVLAAVIPVLAVTVVGMWLVVQNERDAVRRDAIGRVRSAMSAIDAELRGNVSSLEALRASASLRSGDIPAFAAEARRLLAIQPNWLNIGLASADRVQLFDALPSTAPEAPIAVDDDSFERALKSGRPAIGGVATMAPAHAATVRIRVPVAYDGKIRYILTAALDIGSLERVLRAQGLPADWVIALVDRNRRFIVRIPPRPAGSDASQSFREALAREREGFFYGRTLEGAETYTPYDTSSLTGWALGIAIPAATINAGAIKAMATMAIGGALCIAVAMLMAGIIARRVTAPISDLAAAATAIGRGDGAGPKEAGGIDEFVELRRAIDAAARASREREGLLEREKQVLEREKDLLRAVDRAKDEFIAMLSHELRNPLAALSSGAHVLARVDPAHQAFAHAREVIVRQTAHMRRLIEDLLDMSSVLIGKVSLVRERFDLAMLVSDAIAAGRNAERFETHSVTLSAEPVWVNADRSRIEQILANLLDNAFKFTPPGKGIHVTVRGEPGSAVLSVRDEGEGFRSADRERIFELFVQAEQGLQRAQGGMGIGLSLVKRLVELHGGSVSASSAGVGQGAELIVRLPAVPMPQALPAAGAGGTAGASYDVLIVEDNDDVRHTLHDTLALSGHRVREARDGETALELAAELAPDVALIDIGLPGLDGYEVAQRLRTSGATQAGGAPHAAIDGAITLIALTGYGHPDDQLRARAAGFHLHLTKPVQMEELNDVISRVHSTRMKSGESRAADST